MSVESGESRRGDEEFAAEQAKTQRLVKAAKDWKTATSWVRAGVVSGTPFAAFSLFLLVIMPKVKAILEALGGELPPPARFLVTVTDFAHRFWPLFILLIGWLWFLTARYLVLGRSVKIKRGIKIIFTLTSLLIVWAILQALFMPIFH